MFCPHTLLRYMFGGRLVQACAVEFSSEERRAYERLEEEGQEALEGEQPRDTLLVLQRLLRLRRFCNHPALAGVEHVAEERVAGPAEGPRDEEHAERRGAEPAEGSAGSLVRSVQTWLGLSNGHDEAAAATECAPQVVQVQATCAQCGGEQHTCATLACGHRICSACCVAQARICHCQPSQHALGVVIYCGGGHQAAEAAAPHVGSFCLQQMHYCEPIASLCISYASWSIHVLVSALRSLA